MGKNSIILLLVTISISGWSQDAPVLSSNNSFSTINIRANTTSIPVIKFTRYTGTHNHQHNAFVGQFFNPVNGEYSFGIGTGFSSTGDQDFTNHVLTATLNGKVGIGTTSPTGSLHIVSNRASLFLQNTSTNDWSFLRIQGSGTNLWDIGQYGNNDYLEFRPNGNDQNRVVIKQSGYVGIGTTSPDAKLAVKGTVHAQEVKVDLLVPGPDYVFEPTYNLPTLAETEAYIKANKHLPEVPSAKEMEANGINLSEMNMLLLKKVEELMLHVIAIKNEVNSLRQENEELKMKISLSTNKK